MDYEKKYKEALERAKAWKEDRCMPTDTNRQGVLEDIFPELTESDDEKVKKIITLCLEECVHSDIIRDYEKDEAIVWLEKQKSTLPKWKYKKDNTPLLRDSIILNKYGCVAKSPSGAIVSDVWVLDYDELAKLPKEEIEKQDEQKPKWSEEDDTIRCELIRRMEALDHYWNRPYDQKLIDWLKLLKQRIGG